MKKTMRKISIFAVLLFALVSCNDEAFLTENPKYFYTVDNVFSTQQQVEQALVTCYSKLREYRTLSTEATEYMTIRGSNGTDMFDVSTVRHSYQFNDYSILTPEHRVYTNIFSFWYKMISAANLVLYGADLENIEWDNEENYNYAVAQAHFFRAWAYRNLGELYGGVFIVPELCLEPKFNFERSTRVETYRYAISEIEDRIEDFPETSSHPGRLVRGAVQHTLAVLYLDLGIALGEEGLTEEADQAYKKSIEWADKVIDGGTYSLMTSRFGTRMNEGPKYYYANTEADKTEDHTYESAGVKIPGNVIWDMYQPGNISYQDGNHEAIWVIHTDLDAFMEEDKASKLNYSRSFSPTFRSATPGILDGTMEDVGGRGVTWVMPTEYTRTMIFADKWGKGDLRNSEAAMRRTFVGNVPDSKYYGKVIPWSVLNRTGEGGSAEQSAYTQAFPISCKVASDVYPDDKYGGNKSYLYRDDYVIRLAETYLVRAEAYLRRDNAAMAAVNINVVRKRAGCSYLATGSNTDLNLILDERARELIYEEDRWNTLLRMGGTVAVDRIIEYSYWEYPRMGTMKHFNLWPIPQSVIDSNKDVKIEQNEGWK